MLKDEYRITVAAVLLLLAAACGPAGPTTTPVRPAAASTPILPTEAAPSPAATPTTVASTEVPVPATSTTAPPTAAPLPLPAPGGSAGLIAFVSDRDGNGEIYVMDADGSNIRRLTRWRLWDGYPTWSPDGSQIAYYSYLSDKDWVIKVINVDGGDPRQLTDNGICDGAPHWSPEGSQIAYSSDADCAGDHREIYVMNADGSEQQNLTRDPADDFGSSWSPDSQQIVFTSDRDGNLEIYVLDVARAEQRVGDPQRLTDNLAQDYMPAWSPDGTQIAFVSHRDGNDEIYLMDMDGGNVQRLTNDNADDWFPTWSLDGTQLLFNSKRDGGDLDVYVMNRDGTNVRRLTDSPGQDFNAVWQPRPVKGPSAGTWVRLYEQDPQVAAQGALQTGDNGFLLVGSTNYTHNDTAREDIWLCQTDAAGEVLWQRTYGGDGFDRAQAIIPAGDGGYVILAETESFGAGGRDIYVLQVDEVGNEIWSHTMGGPERERAGDIQPVADGGYVVVGSTSSYGSGTQDLFLIRLDPEGQELWSQAFGGEFVEEGHGVHQTLDGGFLVLGEVLHGEGVYGYQDPDILLLRTDAAGEETWSQVWEEPGGQGGFSLLPTSDGDYVITGILVPDGRPDEGDVLLLKIDSQGNLLWDGSLVDASMIDYATDIIETAGGNYVLTGMTARGRSGGILLLETTPDGTVLWKRSLVQASSARAGLRVLEVPSGGYVVAGVAGGPGRTFDAILIKTDAEGNTE
jgi:Tol biopolymer transport system component